MTERFCYCGNPVPKGKSKYCSTECARRMYNGNLVNPDDDDGVGALYAGMPEDFVGVWMLPDELQARNDELEKHGRRICRTHQGAALPLTDQYFYRSRRSGFETECKACFKQRTARNHLRRKRNRLARVLGVAS